MLNYSVAEIRENMRKTRFLATCAIIMGCSITCWAQRPYSFDAKDYVSTDDKRAPQSAFSYDEKANTFTIKASGNNNIAFKMDKERADGKYMITKEHH